MEKYSKKAIEIANTYEKAFFLGKNTDKMSNENIKNYLELIKSINDTSVSIDNGLLARSLIAINAAKLILMNMDGFKFGTKGLSDEKQAYQMILREYGLNEIFELMVKNGVVAFDWNLRDGIFKNLQSCWKMFLNIDDEEKKQELLERMRFFSRFLTKEEVRKCHEYTVNEIEERFKTFSNPEGYRTKRRDELTRNLDTMNEIYEKVIEEREKAPEMPDLIAYDKPADLEHGPYVHSPVVMDYEESDLENDEKEEKVQDKVQAKTQDKATDKGKNKGLLARLRDLRKGRSQDKDDD